MGICSNRALPTAGVIKGNEKHVLSLYNTGTLSAGVTAEDIIDAFVVQNMTG